MSIGTKFFGRFSSIFSDKFTIDEKSKGFIS